MRPVDLGLQLLTLPIPREIRGVSAVTVGPMKSGMPTPQPSTRTLEVPVSIVDNNTERPLSVFKQVSRRDSILKQIQAMDAPKSRSSMAAERQTARQLERREGPQSKIRDAIIYFGEEPGDETDRQHKASGTREDSSQGSNVFVPSGARQYDESHPHRRIHIPNQQPLYSIQGASRDHKQSTFQSKGSIITETSTKEIAKPPTVRILSQTSSIKLLRPQWQRSSASLVQSALGPVSQSSRTQKFPDLNSSGQFQAPISSRMSHQGSLKPSASRLTGTSPKGVVDEQVQDSKAKAALETIFNSTVGSLKSKNYKEKEQQAQQVVYPSQLNVKKMPPAHVKDS